MKNNPLRRAVERLHLAGHSNDFILDHLDISRSYVQRIIQELKEREGIPTRPGHSFHIQRLTKMGLLSDYRTLRRSGLSAPEALALLERNPKP